MVAEAISKPNAKANDPSSKPTAKAKATATVLAILNKCNNKLHMQQKLCKLFCNCGRLKSWNQTDTTTHRDIQTCFFANLGFLA